MSKKMKTAEIEETRKRGKYPASIISNLIFFFLINLFPLWIGKTQGVVTSNWVKVLWAMDLSIITVILGDVILIAYYRKWLKSLIEFFISVTALISAAVFYSIFPLDFSHIVGQWLNIAIRVLLIVGIVGAAIGAIASLGRLLKQSSSAK